MEKPVLHGRPSSALSTGFRVLVAVFGLGWREGQQNDGHREGPQSPDVVDDFADVVAAVAETGEDRVSTPADSGATYAPFQYRTLLQISAALGIPCGHLTNDGAKGLCCTYREGFPA